MKNSPNMEPAYIERAPTLIRDQVAKYLRDAITSFRVRPGSVLVEREICEATSTSRATVREALRQLQNEGLVISEPGRGSLVASLTRDEMRQIYEVRALLEGLACRLFTRNASDEEVEELVTVVDIMADMTNDPAAMLSQKTVFYDVIFNGANNGELRRVVAGMRQRATLVRATSLSIPGRAAVSFSEIRAITDAIVDRDGERAEALCIEHIDSAASAILEAEDSHFAASSKSAQDL